MDSSAIAEGLLGRIEWTASQRGYCRFPGIDLHTNRNGLRDCRVMLDGAPTIHCVHSSCREAVAEANRKLRSAIGRASVGKSDLHWTPRQPTPEEIERRRQADETRRLRERSGKSLARIIAEHRMDA